MLNTNTANTQTSPRFLVAGKESIYKMFDAFIKKTVVEDKAIDFSKPVVQNEDGTVEFAECGKSFSEIIGVAARAPKVAETKQPVRGGNKSQKKEQEQANEFALYKTALDNYLSGMVTVVAEEEAAEDMKVTESKVNDKVKKTMTVSKKFKESFDLAEAHYKWLWSLGMDTLWQGREFVKGDLQATDAAIKDLVSKFVTAAGDEKNTRKVWQDKLKSVFFAQDYAKSSDCLILKEFFSEENKSKSAKQDDAQESGEARKPRKETLVTASKVAAKFEKDIAKCIEKKGYKDFLTKFRKKDIVLMNAIFHRFVSCPTRPEFDRMEDLKSLFVEYVFRKNIDAPIRNGLLHFCNPDKYINFYTFLEKVAYVEHHKTLLNDYIDNGEAKYNGEDSLFYSQKGVTDGEFKEDYRANRTEEKICHIYDKLHAPAASIQ